MKKTIIFLVLALFLIGCEAIEDYLGEEDNNNEELVYTSEVYQVEGSGNQSAMLRAGASENTLVEDGDIVSMVFNAKPEENENNFMITNTGTGNLTIDAIELFETCGSYTLGSVSLPETIAPEQSFYFSVDAVMNTEDTQSARVEIDIREQEDVFTVHLDKVGYSLTDINNTTLLGTYGLDFPESHSIVDVVAVGNSVVENTVVDIDFRDSIDLDDYNNVLVTAYIMTDTDQMDTFNELVLDFIDGGSTVYTSTTLFFDATPNVWDGQFFVMIDTGDFSSDGVDRIEAYCVDGDGNAYATDITVFVVD